MCIGLLKNNGGIYPPRKSVFPSESLELPRQSPQLGNRENICPVELAHKGIFSYGDSSTGRILSHIAQLRTLLWQH